jgi:glycosyltransferase involved in cell wall biosynthesis
MALEMMAPHDIIFYPHPGPAEMMYLRALRPLGFQRHAPTIVHPIEIDLASLDHLPRDVCRRVERLIRWADVVVPITEHVARSLDRRFQRGGPIIPVGVDTKAFRPGGHPESGRLTVVTVGSLIERKQPRLVLELARSFPAHHFLLVGDGPLRAQLEREAPANAEVRGPVPRDGLPALLGSCHVLLHAGRLEGMPKAVLEGMASGLPPVLFGDYRPDWVKCGESGYVVETENEMIEAIGRLLGDNGLRRSMGTAARQVAEQYDWDIVARMWEDLFLEVAARRRAGASMDFEQPRAVGQAESL